MLLIALDDYIALVGDQSDGVSRYRSVRRDLAAKVREHLWDTERQKFVPHIYLQDSPFPDDFDERGVYHHGGMAVAIEAGLLSRDEIAGSLRQMRENVRSTGNRDPTARRLGEGCHLKRAFSGYHAGGGAFHDWSSRR